MHIETWSNVVRDIVKNRVSLFPSSWNQNRKLLRIETQVTPRHVDAVAVFYEFGDDPHEINHYFSIPLTEILEEAVSIALDGWEDE